MSDNLRIERCESRERQESLDMGAYAPGVVLRSECPRCGSTWVMDLENEYVEKFPVIGEVIEVNAYCCAKGCGGAWIAGRIAYVLSVELRPA